MTGITSPPAQFRMTQGISLGKAANILASNPRGVTRAWSYKTGGNVQSRPCMSPDGTIYVGSEDHKVHALRIIDKHTLTDIMDAHPLPGVDDEGMTIQEGWLIIDGIRLRVNESADSEYGI